MHLGILATNDIDIEDRAFWSIFTEWLRPQRDCQLWYE